MAQNNYNGALQKPIGSGFNATSTTSDVIQGIDLKGKFAIVTGGNTGIGLETVKTFPKQGQQLLCLQEMLKKQRRICKGLPMLKLRKWI